MGAYQVRPHVLEFPRFGVAPSQMKHYDPRYLRSPVRRITTLTVLNVGSSHLRADSSDAGLTEIDTLV
jgi:hypothetical protein